MDIKHLLCYPGEQFSPIEYNHSLVANQFSYADPIYQQSEELWPDICPISPYYNSIYTSSQSTRTSRSGSVSSSNSLQSSSRSSSRSPVQHTESLVQHTPENAKKQWLDKSLIRQSRMPYKERRSSVQTRTPWSPVEDELLQKGYEKGYSWAMISSAYLPRRSRGCCWGRFKTLQSKNLINVKQHQHQHNRLGRRLWKSMDAVNQPIAPAQ
ncbi:Homeodomain-like DNA binding domain-containing transcription factor [Phycomyces blakesleeanus]